VAGGVVSAFCGARLVNAVKSEHLIKIIAAILAAGSLIGAALGGLAVGFAPVSLIKTVLGMVLIAAAAKFAITRH
jgi:uncharacterized membrane protein YfcA